MTALSTTWADVEASILADSAAGYTIPEIAARCGWGRQAVARVLARGHVEAYEIILGGIRRGQFSPEVAGEVHRDGTVVEVGE